MLIAATFGFVLFLALIFGDWYQFTSIQSWAGRYGCGVARRQDRLMGFSGSALSDRFNQLGLLQLPHGVARLFQEEGLIVLRPYYQLFSMRFRTAWPLKGTIDIKADEEGLLLQLVKRTPWSSAVITMTWMGIVVFGTVVFVVLFALDGGLNSVGGIFLVLGVVALGILVFAFGLILLSLAYRLEDQRLMQVYQELKSALTPNGRQS